MKLFLSLFLFIFSMAVSFSQKGSFIVTIDKDTIFQEELIKIDYLLDNLSGKFEPPDFESFTLVSGPNTTSSISIINGEKSQKLTYSFILVPEVSGSLVIGKASVVSENGELFSEPINIYVRESSDKSTQSPSRKLIFKYESESKPEPDLKGSPKKRIMKKI